MTHEYLSPLSNGDLEVLDKRNSYVKKGGGNQNVRKIGGRRPLGCYVLVIHLVQRSFVLVHSFGIWATHSDYNFENIQWL